MELSTIYGTSVIAAIILAVLVILAAGVGFVLTRDLAVVVLLAIAACMAVFVPWMILREFVFMPRLAAANAEAVAKAYGVKTTPALMKRVMESRDVTYLGYRMEGARKVRFDGLMQKNILTVFSTDGVVVDARMARAG